MFTFNHWIITKVVRPFIITRLLLILSGYFVGFVLPISPGQNEMVQTTGWLFSSNRLIDMWARWDSGWYVFIIKNGYSSGGSFDIQSNLAFFPGYPLLVKLLTVLLPEQFRTDELTVLLGVLLSNFLLVLALIFLYKVAQKLFDSERTAAVAVWLMLVFPSSFFLSSFYTESLFLFLSLGGYWFALQKKWWLACLFVALAGATRVVGIFLVLPVLYEYVRTKEFSVRKLDFNFFWFFVAPLGIGTFFFYLYTLTGDFFAALKVQNAWGRGVANPLMTVLFPSGFWMQTTPIDQFFVVSSLVVSWRLFLEKIERGKILAVYSFLLYVPTLFTGTLDSFTRYILVVFPLFLYFADMAKDSKRFVVGLACVFMIVQIIYFGLFSQFYWAG